MFSFTRRNVFITTLIISAIVYFIVTNILNIIIEYAPDLYSNTKKEAEINTNIEVIEIQSNSEAEIVDLNIQDIESTEESSWNLEIPKIDLKANISEGTSSSVIAKTIGHFTETPIFNGNVGLASHNRGDSAKYFERIKELKKGDIIIYNTDEGTREYEIIQSVIILETDWSYLEPSEENMITLITCVENIPEYRRCVVGKEIL